MTESRDDSHGYDKASLLKLAGLAVALGAATWLLAPILLPVKLPANFPQLPALRAVNPSMREVLKTADREARGKPGSAEAVGKLAMAYHANLFLEQAGQAYRIAERLAPNDYRWVYCQAFLAEENGDEQKQRRLLEQTLRLKPDHVPALLKMADAWFKTGRLDEAAHYYELALRAPGSNVSLQANFGLARVAARRQDWNQAIAYSAALAQTYPYLQPPFELLQEAYTGLGQAKKAAEAHRSILSAKWKVVPPLDDPLSDQLMELCYSSTRLLKQAGLLSHLGYPDRALEIARRAAQAEPADPDIRNFIARTLLNGHADKPEAVDEALTQLAECLRLRPDDPVPLWMFAQDFFDTPQTPAAVEKISGLMRPYAGRADAHFYLGLVADARGESAEAESQFRAALQNDPANSGVYNKLGVAAVRAGKLDEAIVYLRKSVELSPMNTTARFNLGAALLQRGKDAEGMKELTEVLRLKPDYAAAHFCMGFGYLYSKRIDEATVQLREGLRYRPDDPEAHFGMGLSLSTQHKRADAIVELREALRLRPNYTEAQDLLRQLDR